ncbi:methyltransferase domain-containing protein [Pseudonocardia phyllosphaerae]|uniref:methyltransferase domain-containing protein n=1 Tax=Pseudonocardia phyllosphaerae TaxID=3390502 RepID=UPI00397CD308
MTALAGFDAPLAGVPSSLHCSDGSEIPLDTHRWTDPAGGCDEWLLRHCTGPTVDLGCGPGRLLVALGARGVPALGVDGSAVAAGYCRHHGVSMLRTDLFGPLPDEGSWAHVLLADGNLGIGGDPAGLLLRAARLLSPGGTVLVEVDPRHPHEWRGTARVSCDDGVSDPLPWAICGSRATIRAAARAGLRVTDVHPGTRVFLELTRR